MNRTLTTRTNSGLEILGRDFVRKLDSLVKTKNQLVDATAELTERMIRFASSLTDLEEEARRLDKANFAVSTIRKMVQPKWPLALFSWQRK